MLRVVGEPCDHRGAPHDTRCTCRGSPSGGPGGPGARTAPVGSRRCVGGREGLTRKKGESATLRFGCDAPTRGLGWRGKHFGGFGSHGVLLWVPSCLRCSCRPHAQKRGLAHQTASQAGLWECHARTDLPRHSATLRTARGARRRGTARGGPAARAAMAGGVDWVGGAQRVDRIRFLLPPVPPQKALHMRYTESGVHPLACSRFNCFCFYLSGTCPYPVCE